jgi:hypothetical protein
MKRFAIVTTFAAAVAALTLWNLPKVQADDAKCGEKGQPSCPLQGWMEKNMQDPMDKNDLAKVAASLEKAATFVPDPKWNDGDNGWAKIAKAGAAAAKAGKASEVKAACKSCHKAWRNEYKKQFRMKPISG